MKGWREKVFVLSGILHFYPLTKAFAPASNWGTLAAWGSFQSFLTV